MLMINYKLNNPIHCLLHQDFTLFLTLFFLFHFLYNLHLLYSILHIIYRTHFQYHNHNLLSLIFYSNLSFFFRNLLICQLFPHVNHSHISKNLHYTIYDISKNYHFHSIIITSHPDYFS